MLVGGLRLSPFFIVTEVLKVFLVDAYFGVIGQFGFVSSFLPYDSDEWHGL